MSGTYKSILHIHVLIMCVVSCCCNVTRYICSCWYSPKARISQCNLRLAATDMPTSIVCQNMKKCFTQRLQALRSSASAYVEASPLTCFSKNVFWLHFIACPRWPTRCSLWFYNCIPENCASNRIRFAKRQVPGGNSFQYQEVRQTYFIYLIADYKKSAIHITHNSLCDISST